MHKRVHYVTRHVVSKRMYKEICRHILSREPLPTKENNPDAFFCKITSNTAKPAAKLKTIFLVFSVCWP